MPKITKITSDKQKERVYVDIDNAYCTSIRFRTWSGIALKIDDEISCEDLKEKEKYFWKKAYGKSSWEKEKIRIKRVSLWFKKYIPEVEVIISGFGAAHTDEILSHPEESGEPDLIIQDNESKIEILLLEVTGTEYMRGEGYWVRPDKLEYAANHLDKDVWIALHYQNPAEKIIWIKPEQDTTEKKIKDINIRGAIEKYMIFFDSDKEVRTSKEFKDHILNKLNRCNPNQTP